MAKKPKGAKYRNLYVFQGWIYFERVVHGRRYRVNTETTDWNEAALYRDKYEEAKQIGRKTMYAGATPTFAEMTERYLKEDTAHLATRTRSDRRHYLAKNGLLLPYFGRKRLDEITPAMLREWWGLVIQEAGRATQTGRHHVNAVAAVFAYAKDLGIAEASPVPGFREQLSRQSRTKRGRAETTPGRKVTPIEDPAGLVRLVDAAVEEGSVANVAVLLQLDAGLRLGEAMGLRWGAIAWGEHENDRSRAIVIDQSKPSGVDAVEETKSGRPRRVAVSRRLRRALRALYEDRFRPGPHALVLEGVDSDNFRRREWRRICERAEIGHRQMKDLRDTFASQLFSVGVQLGYVSRQLGHADITTTARHYAKWIDVDEYREPMALAPDEVPADLLARRVEKSPYSPHNENEAGEADFTNIRDSGNLGGSGGQTRTADLRLMKPPL